MDDGELADALQAGDDKDPEEVAFLDESLQQFYLFAEMTARFLSPRLSPDVVVGRSDPVTVRPCAPPPCWCLRDVVAVAVHGLVVRDTHDR